MDLIVTPNIADPDGFYEELIDAQRDLSDEEAELMNAKLVLTLANHPRVWERVRDPNGRAAKLAKGSASEAAAVEELFLAALGRPPTAAERDACRKYLADAGSPAAGLPGVLWGLLNTREFVLQH